MENTNLKITKVSVADKAKLKLLSKKAGYTNVSSFMRVIIARVVSQDNLDFLIYNDVPNQLIAQNELLDRLVKTNNVNQKELEQIKKLMTNLVKGEF